MSPPPGPDGQAILVTGGAGFIGGHLVAALAPDNDVTVLDDGSAGDLGALPDGVTLTEADVRDADAVADAIAEVDLVYHLAAVVSVEESVDDPVRSHAVNVDGTLAVLEAARETGARAVVTSSAAIYGAPETVPIPETAPPDPRSPYGLEKYAADRYARLYAELYGADTVVLRPFNVYGPGQTGEYAGVITAFAGQAAAGGPLTVHGDGSQTRDFVHVDDVVAAFRRAGTADVAGRAFNVGTGTAVSIAELAALVAELTGDPAIVHTERRPGDVDRSCADVTAAREALGYEPSIELADGLRRLLA